MKKGHKEYDEKVNNEMYEVVEMVIEPSCQNGYDNILFKTLDEAKKYAENIDAIPKNMATNKNGRREIWISRMTWNDEIEEYENISGDVLEIIQYKTY